MLTDPDVMMWGGELVLRDGVPVGQITAAAWGATLGACVALAYVSRPDGDVVTREFLTSGRYELNVGGTVVAAAARLRAPTTRQAPASAKRAVSSVDLANEASFRGSGGRPRGSTSGVGAAEQQSVCSSHAQL